MFRLRLASDRIEQFIILERTPFLLYSLSFFILHSPFLKFVPSLCYFFSFYERFDSEELWDNAVSRILWIAVLKIHVRTAFRRKIRLSSDLHWKSLLFIPPVTFEFSNKFFFYFTPLCRILKNIYVELRICKIMYMFLIG